MEVLHGGHKGSSWGYIRCEYGTSNEQDERGGCEAVAIAPEALDSCLPSHRHPILPSRTCPRMVIQ